MADIKGVTPVSAEQLRGEIRQRIAQVHPDLRVIADDFMGLASPIDLLATNDRGEVFLLLLALEGEDDAALLTRALAQRAWAGPRVRDWAKLAPDLELAPDAPVCAILLAPSFSLETRAAAVGEDMGTLEDVVEPFLIHQGFLDRTPRGRVATPRALEFWRAR